MFKSRTTFIRFSDVCGVQFQKALNTLHLCFHEGHVRDSGISKYEHWKQKYLLKIMEVTCLYKQIY